MKTLPKTNQKQINVFDVANYLIKKTYSQNIDLNNTKLQKLLYYAQAYHLVKNHQLPLFLEPIEAWDYGPVIPDVYFEFRKYYGQPLKPSVQKPTNINLNVKQKETIKYVIKQYAHLNANILSKQTHEEDPWQDSCQNFDFSLNRITHKQLFNFFKNKF